MPVHLKFQNEDDEIQFYQDVMAKIGGELSNKLGNKEFIASFLRWEKSVHK